MALGAPAILLTAAATVLAILISVGTGILVARVRRRVNIFPPVMTGAPELDRAVRVQGNTLEQFVLFVPSLWLAALYFQGWIPPIIGLVWCVGRIVYAAGYIADANRRHVGFLICILSIFALVILAAIGIINAWTVSA